MPKIMIRQQPLVGMRRFQGNSIVELMVGITIGLFILAGASLVLTTQLGDNRRLLLETQVQQDLRSAVDLISRDLRRAGYWPMAYLQIWPTGNSPVLNPYRAATPAWTPSMAASAVTTTTSSLAYSRSTGEEGNPIGTDRVPPLVSADHSGFRLTTTSGIGTIEAQLGQNNWQALTDSAVLNITTFTMDVAQHNLPLPCGALCPGPGGCPLVLGVRDVTLTVVAQAVGDAAVQRSLTQRIRLRNDLAVEEC
jgi:prepilin peptidase dependent protein B